MDTVDRGIHAHGPIDVVSPVRFGDDPIQITVPHPMEGMATMTLPHRLPWAIRLSTQARHRIPIRYR